MPLEDSITDAYSQGIFIHEIFACLFIVPYLCYIYIFFTYKTFLDLNKKVYFIMPITIFLLSVTLVTGSFLFTMRQFILDSKIIAMIGVLILFFAGEIYRLKTLKKAKTSREGMQKYASICKIMYLCFFVLAIAIIGFIKAYKG